MMQALELGIPTQQTELDLPQADDIEINDLGPVMRAAGNGIELFPMNLSFSPPDRVEDQCSIFGLRGGISTKATGASSPRAHFSNLPARNIQRPNTDSR